MSNYLSYAIKERQDDGKIVVLATVTSEDAKRAFLMARVFVKARYEKAGIERPLFETEPRFFAEAVGSEVTEH